MDQEFFRKPEPPPRVSDARIAMRLPSLAVFLASAIFACTPILYYGVSHEASAANCVCVGGILLISALLRLWFPIETVGFSWFNAILGLWVFISPFALGYFDQTAYTVNTMLMGFIIVAMSITSVYSKRSPGTPVATAYEDRQGLEEQDYDYIGTDRY